MSSESDTSSDEEMIRIINMLPRPKIYRKRLHPFAGYDDVDFKARFRFSKETVLHLMETFNLDDILSYGTNRNHPVSPINQFLLALRFFATGSYQLTLGDHLNLHKSTVSRTVSRVTTILASRAAEFIQLPRTEEEIRITNASFYQLANFPRVLGAIDCTHVKMISPGGDNAELYRNRKGWFSINVQAVCDASLKITNIVARWPGSVHDSRIFNTSLLRAKLEAGEYGNAWLIGDSGYACKSYLLTPLLNPVSPADKRYNRAHVLTRNTIERTFGILKKRFACLHIGLRVKPEKAVDIIVAITVLHNIAIQLKDDLELLPDVPEENINNNIEIVNAGNVHERTVLINTHFT
ncbi:hypothetical protein RN001_016092 [Aquatica leii]|uniref:Putative nuclease HARBI1 n=1 Tax=Aquatica leii TaxID=1421715 RepID=A0AAN7QB31_9COLE|nr:hypothetical protein RN001_016092 [Aquatica leii]